MVPRRKSSLAPYRPRNDPLQYDDLADSWWQPHGPLAMLHWIAKARASRIPAASRPGAVLVDLACGAGLLAPFDTTKGYVHVGLDINVAALRQAAAHDVRVVVGDVLALPFGNASADVVSAGEILEHVSDHEAVIAEACRILRPGGTLVIDTIASTWIARVVAVHIAERVPGGAPPGIHDPRLFVDRKQLRTSCAAHGVELQLNGLRPTVFSMIAWLVHLRSSATMKKTPYTGVLFQAVGRKESVTAPSPVWSSQ